MRAGAQARTIFAGFGVSGSLLAAVGAVFVLVGGVLAFDQLPRAEGPAPERVLEVAAAAGGSAPLAADAPAVALPAAAPAPAISAATDSGGDGPSGPTGEPSGREPPPGGPQTIPPATPPPAGPVPATNPGAAPGPRTPPNLAADTVEAAAGTSAGTLRALGRVLPLAAPATESAAAAVHGAGTAVGRLLRGD